MNASMHSCIHRFICIVIYSYPFIRFYHDLAIHVLSIFLSCMLLLIHVFLSCSIYSFMYDNHIFISYTLIYPYIHIMSSTCNILYLVNLYLPVLYQTIISYDLYLYIPILVHFSCSLSDCPISHRSTEQRLFL